MGTPGKAIALASGKAAVLSSTGRLAVKNAGGACDACCGAPPTACCAQLAVGSCFNPNGVPQLAPTLDDIVSASTVFATGDGSGDDSFSFSGPVQLLGAPTCFTGGSLSSPLLLGQSAQQGIDFYLVYFHLTNPPSIDARAGGGDLFGRGKLGPGNLLSAAVGGTGFFGPSPQNPTPPTDATGSFSFSANACFTVVSMSGTATSPTNFGGMATTVTDTFSLSVTLNDPYQVCPAPLTQPPPGVNPVQPRRPFVQTPCVGCQQSRQIAPPTAEQVRRFGREA